ncbi:MAG: glycerol-3-phosphate dehydrogenase/oxidase [Micropepsaceae bacterium]
MQRIFRNLGSQAFDVAIVGGGITGACIARDAARRGLSVVLVDKGDFSCGTSAGSTKLVHGGLRYLKTMEFALIRESLRERRVWERIAPHMVYPMPFILPLKKPAEKWVVGAGLTLYDFLSYDRNWIDDPDQKMPGHRAISATDARKLEPALEHATFDSAMLYYDCQMYSPERLGLECLMDASAHGAVVANYVEAISFEKQNGAVHSIRVRDALNGNEANIRAKVVVNAAGPWADRMLELVDGGNTSHKLIRSKGIHVVTRAITSAHALAVSHKGGHFFIVPWRDHSIIGTTDTVFTGTPDELRVTQPEIEEFLAFVNEGLPGLGLSNDHVCYAYAGLRPLVDDGSNDSYNASRKAEIIDHGGEGGTVNLLSAIGGKWTTSRDIAEKCVNIIVRKLNAAAKKCDTGDAPLPGSAGRHKAKVAALSGAHPELAPSAAANLARNYGALSDAVLDLAKADASLLRSLSQRLPDIAAQVVHAVRTEMAMTLEDVVFRRTGLGTLGPLDAGAIGTIANLMASELKWSEKECQRQIGSLGWRYEALAHS